MTVAGIVLLWLASGILGMVWIAHLYKERPKRKHCLFALFGPVLILIVWIIVLTEFVQRLPRGRWNAWWDKEV
jgi:hypothetical protein